jgi:mitogen-activated protein kinase kinase kinase 13
MSSAARSSPPATRTRSRKHSNDNIAQPVASTSTSSKSKGKGKQVEFDDQVQIAAFPEAEQESDLTDLAELEESIGLGNPSPRRLRSKGDKPRTSSQASQDNEVHAGGDVDLGRRVTPMRKAKRNMGSLKEDDTEEEEDELIESDAEDIEPLELPESPTPKASRVRRTPLRNRLRSRATQEEAPSDGDDEGSDDGSVDVTKSVDGDEEEEGEEQEVDDVETVREESEDEEMEDEPTIVPRVLRNGKILGDGEVEDEDEVLTEELSEEDAEGEEVEEDETVEADAASVDLENEDEDGDGEEEEDTQNEDETMEDDSECLLLSAITSESCLLCIVDLTSATAKSLQRLRRDDLVRLCEHRDLEVSGTKPQLAEALLQWRDKHNGEASSPSSTGTARPPSTTRPRRRKTRSRETRSPPVLERSERVHIDEPRTPPLTAHNKEAEPELELDLESLGLEDREIPPEKITKLEKIGSGGFKDVFIGKFKGRKVALAEFRGQLNASE